MNKSTWIIIGAVGASSVGAAAAAFLLSGKSIKQLIKTAPKTEETPKEWIAPAIETPVEKPMVSEIPKMEEVVEEVSIPIVESIPEPIPEPIPAPIPEPVPVVEPEQTPSQIMDDLPMGLPYIPGKLDESGGNGFVLGGVGVEPEQREIEKNDIEPEIVANSLPIINMNEVVEEAEKIGDDALPPIDTHEVTEEPKEEIGDALPSFESSDEIPTISLSSEVMEEPKEEVKEEIIEEPKAEIKEETEEKKEEVLSKKIGDNTVSLDPNDNLICLVNSEFNIDKDKLVSISSESGLGLVFEFMYPTMKNEATLINVYSKNPEGKLFLPPKEENDSVLAFGRSFITDSEEFKKFLQQ